jgi:PilZ domain
MGPSQERRQCGRVPFRTRVTVSLRTSQALVKANVLDISLNGVRLICAEPVTEGENALLEFRLKSGTGVQIEQLWSRVIHVRMDDDAWVVGLKFKQVLDRQTTPLLPLPAGTNSEHQSEIPDDVRPADKGDALYVLPARLTLSQALAIRTEGPCAQQPTDKACRPRSVANQPASGSRTLGSL